MAEQHLAEAKIRITRQESLIAQLAAASHDTKVVNELLRTMVEVLTTMETHYQMMLDEIEQEHNPAASGAEFGLPEWCRGG